MSIVIEMSPSASPRFAAPLVVVDMVWPDQSNHHGTLFGGAALAMLDRIAFIVGSKELRGTVVTAAVSPLDFTAPAPAGHLVECSASVIHRGRRSVTVGTQLVAENLLSGERISCLTGKFVMVRQDAEPRPAVAEIGAATQAPQEAGEEPLVMVAEIVFPGHANHRGILHGGPAMAWMAKAGFVAATRQSRRTVVMAGSEKLDFKASAYVGDVVEVTACVTRIGRRSISVQVEMWAEEPTTGERRHCTSAKFTYVAIET